MADALYEVRGASRIFRMGEVSVKALKPVDLEVREGEVLVILGPSGSGKSTLLHLLGGMDKPNEGSVRFRDTELTGLDQTELTDFRRRHVGFVFQFYNLIPSLTARENVALVTEIVPDPLEPAEALQLVGLGDRLDHFPSQLSGGVKPISERDAGLYQKVLFEFALAISPYNLPSIDPRSMMLRE